MTDEETWTLLTLEQYRDWEVEQNALANPERLPAPTWCKVGPHPGGLACASCAPTIQHHLDMKGVYGT